jgi:isopentenyl diphosphate isomerase/L-lactate dehydrogenase-like FMN-dependent dehydrogenase
MSLLVKELRLAMILAGCGSVCELDRSWITFIPDREPSGARSVD